MFTRTESFREYANSLSSCNCAHTHYDACIRSRPFPRYFPEMYSLLWHRCEFIHR